MKTIHVYDPALCCPTGVCGPSVDPVLVQFAADFDWLKSKGVTVERFNLAQQPGAFAENAVVREQLAANGTDCLPLVLADGAAVASGSYPSRRQLAEWAGIPYEESKAAPAFVLPMADSGCCPWPGSGDKGGSC